MLRTTITELAVRRHRTGLSYRQLAGSLGLASSAAGLLSDVVRERHEHVSLRAENIVRAALGLPLRVRPHYVRPCLSPDPARRLAQLARLTAQAERELADRP